MTLKIKEWTAHHNQILYSLLYYCEVNKQSFDIKYDPDLSGYGIILNVNNSNCFLDYSDDIKFMADARQFDYYFKRSLLPGDMSGNIYPLNFNHTLTYKPLHLIGKMPVKVLKNKKSRIELTRALDYFGIVTNDSHTSKDIKYFSEKKLNDNNGRVIFMARLWDPARSKDPEEKERRNRQNHFRINACRVISRNFSNSITGIYPDTFAKEEAKDVLLDLKVTRKKNYLSELQKADICIADDGLKDTPGWKIGEYIIMKKAIISTPIQTVVEEFETGKNYISTNNRDNFECLPDLVSDLLKNKKYMEVKRNNEVWYNKYMRPDIYIENIIRKTTNDLR